MSAAMLAAGPRWPGWAPPACATALTITPPSRPITSPRTTAAGAVQTGHGT